MYFLPVFQYHQNTESVGGGYLCNDNNFSTLCFQWLPAKLLSIKIFHNTMMLKWHFVPPLLSHLDIRVKNDNYNIQSGD